jgi:hypothetical protein
LLGQVFPAFHQETVTQDPQALPLTGLGGQCLNKQRPHTAALPVDCHHTVRKASEEHRTLRQDAQTLFELEPGVLSASYPEKCIAVPESGPRVVWKQANDITVESKGVLPDVVMTDAKDG